MIYTVTFNPSLDYVLTVKDFTVGVVNRTSHERLFPGGKGINVSMVLKNLGCESTALGYVAGFTGKEIVRLLNEKEIHTDFIALEEGMSRINVKLKAEKETEINATGPCITEKDTDRLYKKLNKLNPGDILVLAGSIPGSMPDSIYSDIMEYLKDRQLQIVVDATGELLMKVLSYHPFLIKPNHHELEEIFGKKITNRQEAVQYAKILQEKGAKNVLVSMAGEGAVLVTETGEEYQAKAPAGQVINSVGAGDSMVAGFLYGYSKNKDYKEAFRYGLCTGSASAFSEELAQKRDVEALVKESVKVR
ncbi:MAG: 1-phosphofructokinase [Lachnospiraceae bacterium]|nr:1-phosphofructokinase [Lachnospiraceae bacterium]